MKKENILLLSSVTICITLLLGIYDSWKVDIVLGLGIINLVTAFLVRQEQQAKTNVESSLKIKTSVSAISPYTSSALPHTFSYTQNQADTHVHTSASRKVNPTPSPISFSPSPLDGKHTPVRKPRRRKVVVEQIL